ncbi:MAG: NAD(P)H-dependent oxidoreductase [Micrococcales bacterium]|nr:NAD(P)H-dependent oxidoreductase [Micrococcales bacterium]
MKIGIIVGSIRDGRNGEKVATWVKRAADTRGDADYEVIDLKDFDVPMLTSATVPGMANKQYDSAEVTRWSQAVDACDAFVFVTPEYNHGVPGAFKNAVDSLGPEWTGKVFGLVSYGADNGVRAVEQWRQILANFEGIVVRGQVSLSLFTEIGESEVTPEERRGEEIKTLLDQVTKLAATRG